MFVFDFLSWNVSHNYKKETREQKHNYSNKIMPNAYQKEFGNITETVPFEINSISTYHAPLL